MKLCDNLVIDALKLEGNRTTYIKTNKTKQNFIDHKYK